jgi:hypothetical protein
MLSSTTKPMRFRKTKHRFFVLIAGCCGFAGTALANTLPPIWFQPTGSPITSWNDVSNGVGFYTLSFPFQFNFLGINYTSATLASNGAIYFSPPPTLPPTIPQPQASPDLFRQGAWPTIAPAWYGIQDIDGSGSVFVNTLADREVISFMGVASCAPPVCAPAPASDLATFQVSLDSDGSVIFAYQALNSLSTGNTLVGSAQAIVGVTGARGATDPSINLSGSAQSPGYLYTSTGSTVYQTINNGDNSQLAGLDLIFTPHANLTWQVTSDFPGNPSPEPATFFEITLSLLTLYAWRRRNRRPSCGRS